MAGGNTQAKRVTQERRKLLRSLPSLSALLAHQEVKEWLDGLPRAAVLASLRSAVAESREAILSGEVAVTVTVEELIAAAEHDLMERSIPSLRRVINATGIVLHTGLGRAPLSETAIEAVVETASGYSNLEFDLTTGRRGRRTSHVIEHLLAVTGAEAATVVNNNAAATLLILQVLAAGREVVVSRGQLIEIGGSFRLPDIMSASGATLKEVGTTNRTHRSDYERAIGDATAMLLRVHPSNYRVVGFTEEVDIAEMAALAHEHDLIAVDDLGSGALLDLTEFGLPAEPCVAASIEAGADLACFSGDKLLGGPQCGIIIGRADLIAKINAAPLMRTYRVDKMTLAGLEATLRAYLDPEDAIKNIPTLAMLTASTDVLARRARLLCERLQAALPDEPFYVCSDVSYAGGGAMPAQALETVVVQWRPKAGSAEEMAAALREADVPVVTRVRNDAICLDLRTLREADIEPLVSSLAEAAWEEETEDDGEEETDGISLPVIDS